MNADGPRGEAPGVRVLEGYEQVVLRGPRLEQLKVTQWCLGPLHALAGNASRADGDRVRLVR